jgi:uncharacterized protein YndB with AHSA1/START domain
MDQNARTEITAEVQVNAPVEKIWELWTTPRHIMQWNNLSHEWHTPSAENDARTGGRFLFVMGLKDGSFKFNYTGTYDEVIPLKMIRYTLDDGRRTRIVFSAGYPVKITETFDADDTQPTAMQKDYCQAVLNSFKQYAEADQ